MKKPTPYCGTCQHTIAEETEPDDGWTNLPGAPMHHCGKEAYLEYEKGECVDYKPVGRKTRCGRDMTCILCKYFYLCAGCPGYSEVTPSSPMSIFCSKGHWDVDSEDTNTARLREVMISAQTCKDFRRYDEEDAT